VQHHEAAAVVARLKSRENAQNDAASGKEKDADFQRLAETPRFSEVPVGVLREAIWSDFADRSVIPVPVVSGGFLRVQAMKRCFMA
jgi:hypothetical protein